MKNKKKKAFTLVELLAVIVILAVILVIAIPQIMNTIKAARLGTIEDSAKLIAKNAENDYLTQQTLNEYYAATSIPCSDVTKLSEDYASCSITYDDSGIATVKLKGASGSKFNNISCSGTKDNMNCREKVQLPGYTDAVEYLTQKYNNGTNSEGLIQTNGTELRYQGENPNNYVYFNCTDNLNPTRSTCEVWRIVGVFDGRVKLVRKDSIGYFSWDTNESTINNGSGINEWGKSGTYEGADLMRELNEDYLNSSLSTNTNWYNGANNSLGSGNFNKSYVLKESAQELIGNATWYTGGIPHTYNSIVTFIVTLAETYAAERGTQGKICTSGISCNDTVTRTYAWTGKVGLIYPSDYGYASGNSNCATNISYSNSYCDTNWMANYGWTITPAPHSSSAYNVWGADSASVGSKHAISTIGVRPSVYLISDIQIKGSGTTSDPYVFAE